VRLWTGDNGIPANLARPSLSVLISATGKQERDVFKKETCPIPLFRSVKEANVSSTPFPIAEMMPNPVIKTRLAIY